ncbi:MAG: ATP-grasp domain-containing protein, partial [Pseudomonadales bacterium]|nr:ATP-grasp domain-containing protein [Pseudomonadales bacterium]
MKRVSFDPYRTLGFPDTIQLKPERFLDHQDPIRQASWVLFPEYWQVNTLVFAMQARIFPSYAAYQLGHNKVEMTRAFQAIMPRHVPETWIRANSPREAQEIWQEITLPCVAKLPKSSQGQGVWLIQDQGDWKEYLTRTDTLYIQEYLPIDRDIRVVVVGNRVVGSYWRLQSANGFHNNIARGGFIDTSDVPRAALDLAINTARHLGIDHAGFDIAMVSGHPYLLEFNRLFGNQGLSGGTQLLRDRILDYL